MKNNPLLLICLISAITAIVTTVALKLFGFEGIFRYCGRRRRRRRRRCSTNTFEEEVIINLCNRYTKAYDI